MDMKEKENNKLGKILINYEMIFRTNIKSTE